MMLRAKSRRTREWLARARAADAAMYDLDPTDMSDAALAQCVAEYFVTRGPPPHRLFILHDVRPSAERNIARARKQFPNYQPAESDRSVPARLRLARARIWSASAATRTVPPAGSSRRCGWVTRRRAASAAAAAAAPAAARGADPRPAS